MLMRHWSSISAAAIDCGIDVYRLYRIVRREAEMAVSEAADIAATAGISVADVITSARAVRQRAGLVRSKAKVETSPGGRNTERGKE